MSDSYRPSAEVRRAIISLRKLLKEDGAPDPGEAGIYRGLMCEQRQLLHAWQMADKVLENWLSTQQEQPEGLSPDNRPAPREDGVPPTQESGVDAARTGPVPVRDVPTVDMASVSELADEGDGDEAACMPFQPTLDLAEPEGIAVDDGGKPCDVATDDTAAQPPPTPGPESANDQPASGAEGTHVPAGLQPAEAARRDPGPAAPSASEADEKALAPQPGGVPALLEHEVQHARRPVKTVLLKNAKAGEPYEAPFPLDELKDARLTDDGGSGLAFDSGSKFVHGVPQASGDYKLRFCGILNERVVEVWANLAVIPDPKSLWTSKPSDQSDPFWKPDTDFQSLTGELLCVAASKRGRSHAREGGFRDDDVGLFATAGGWHVAVVADGAGSARFSRRGSRVAVETVLTQLPPLLEEHLTGSLDAMVAAHRGGVPDANQHIKVQLYQSLATAAFEAARRIGEEATAHDAPTPDFSTTLAVAVARRAACGAWFFGAFSIGDGGIAVFDAEDGTVTPLTAADSGEFAGQTRFLSRSEFAGGFEQVGKRLFFDVRDRFTALIAMTDGITDPKFPTDVAFADPDRWIEFWRDDLSAGVALNRDNPDIERQLLTWLDFWSPGNHDDRTLAVLVP